MFEASITDLGESSGVGDAATKHYVETLVGASAGARVGEATLGPAFSVVNPGHHTINCGGNPTTVFSHEDIRYRFELRCGVRVVSLPAKLDTSSFWRSLSFKRPEPITATSIFTKTKQLGYARIAGEGSASGAYINATFFRSQCTKIDGLAV